MIEALRRPRRLRAGDRVAVVSPSSAAPEDRMAAGLAILREWGLDPVVMPYVNGLHPRLAYLPGSDEARAADLQQAWSDPGFAAVVSTRGGYGAQRMLDFVDWEALRGAEPKVYIGFSDATALHEALAVNLGVATLHGPMPTWSAFIDDTATREHLRRTLFEPEAVRKLAPPTARALVSGRAEGVTFGGCLSLLASSVGTGEDRPDGAGGILLLEDTAEEDYRLDRYLTQLRRSGLLDGVAGIALGSWIDCGPEDEVRAVVMDRLGDLGVPILEGVGFGHCTPSWTVPLGVPATLDADAGTLTFAVPALR
ncbi:S66 peptidase family protein [Glycomyces arizonensis]|uniref:S66 peptidase family protein n=1 Tax=Glycomyces arizonensis TaxID=256035 RepID=UPI0004166D08|nr:LD-carboxypeptidase [Glycomyces arizonensis]